MKILVFSILISLLPKFTGPVLITSQADTVVADTGFAVVELFTSEGCSSCPPADALVARIAKETASRPVFYLSYHVDYWNRLGWTDPYSSPAYSARQKHYSSLMHLNGVYTPQIVVNGQTEFVGSNQQALRRAITANLQKPAALQLNLTELHINDNKIVVNYEASQNGANQTLLIAVVQNNASTQVKAGENSGRNLRHINIVRQMQTVSLVKQSAGTATINMPVNFTAGNWKLFGLVQNSATGEILAVKEANP